MSVFCSTLNGSHIRAISTTLSNVNSRLAMTSMILIIILLTKIFAFIIKQSFFVNKNHIITRRQERSPAGILAGLVRVQPQLL